MMAIQAAAREVMERAEWVAIATAGPEGPHLVATWGDYVRKLGIEEDRLLVPAGHYQKTEQNLKADGRVELLFATRQVQGSYGPGQGCCVRGQAEFQSSGPDAERAKAQFPWARGVLVIHIQYVQLQL